jgi:uncharacterized membrane protein YhdT
VGLLRWLIEKLAVYIFIFSIVYVVGELLGVVPKPLKDFVNWFASNFTVIALTLCVLAICYTFIRLSHKEEKGEWSK